ncbi:unnamed protein product [Caenorhabditis sp. 36 PRJEB53466]|nr:unnamed protein product [Caenorhabditis sp. 36 PRJEB53466]
MTILIFTFRYSEDELIEETFKDMVDPQEFEKLVILAPLNDLVDDLNGRILRTLHGRLLTFRLKEYTLRCRVLTGLRKGQEVCIRAILLDTEPMTDNDDNYNVRSQKFYFWEGKRFFFDYIGLYGMKYARHHGQEYTANSRCRPEACKRQHWSIMNTNPRSVLRPDEMITSNHAQIFPGLGARRRCQPSTSQEPPPNVETQSIFRVEDVLRLCRDVNRASSSQPPYQPQPYPPESLFFAPEQGQVAFNLEQPFPELLKEPEFEPEEVTEESKNRENRRKKRSGGNQKPLSQKVLDKVIAQMDELADDIRQNRSSSGVILPRDEFKNRLLAKETVKFYDDKYHGYVIVNEERSEKEQLEIARSNYEILKFVYSRQFGDLDWSPIEMEILHKIDEFILFHNESAFRDGALSVIIDFDVFPPGLSWRNLNLNNQDDTVLLRPVVVDGVAVQYAASGSTFRPFRGRQVLQPPWRRNLHNQALNLSVKPIFDIVMGFLIRGHKITVFLPDHYKNPVTRGGISKVDDLVAFRKLVDLKFIEFRGIKDKGIWFRVMADMADKREAVFVSSQDYSKRNDKCEYLKPSERILTPCFLNTEDRVMVLQPNIRVKMKNNKYRIISPKEILCANPNKAQEMLGHQLYLDQQIQLICELCQLYPMKSLHKVSIKQLLMLVVRAESAFGMPFMDSGRFESLMRMFGNEEGEGIE